MKKKKKWKAARSLYTEIARMKGTQLEDISVYM